MEKAVAGWGEVPDWIAALAQACDRTSQNRVAKDLGRSAAMISQVLTGKYPADLTDFRELVRGKLMSETVDCPILGDLPKDACLDWRKKSRSFDNVNSRRVQMYRACNRCPLNRKEPTDVST